jgi:hypothetical protein
MQADRPRELMRTNVALHHFQVAKSTRQTRHSLALSELPLSTREDHSWLLANPVLETDRQRARRGGNGRLCLVA